MGVRGMRLAATELLKWPDMFEERELRANLFSLYLFIEIGGTGGGCFRYMYSRFLQESARISGHDGFAKPAEDFQRAGENLSGIGLLFKDAVGASDLGQRIREASDMLRRVTDLEERAYLELERSIADGR